MNIRKQMGESYDILRPDHDGRSRTFPGQVNNQQVSFSHSQLFSNREGVPAPTAFRRTTSWDKTVSLSKVQPGQPMARSASMHRRAKKTTQRWGMVRGSTNYTPRRYSWMSLMEQAQDVGRRRSARESFCLDQNEHGDLLQEASVESAEHQKMSHIMEEAMRIATEHANEHMEKRMKELAMRERDLADSTRKLEEKLDSIPSEAKIQLGISSMKSMGSVITSFRSSSKFSSSGTVLQGMTAISISELSALRERLRDHEKAEELRQKLVAQNRLDQRRNAEMELEQRHVRASHKIMNNWRMRSCRKCIKAWAQTCAETRVNKGKMQRVLMRLTFQTRSKSFSQWMNATQNSIKIAEQKAMEESLEKKFRTKLYSSLNNAQVTLKESEKDAESLYEMLKLARLEQVDLLDTIEEMKHSEEKLQQEVKVLNGFVEQAKHSWDSDKEALIRRKDSERHIMESKWIEKYDELKAKHKKHVTDSDAEIAELADSLQTAQGKTEEWKSMYAELQQISDFQMGTKRKSSVAPHN